MDILVFGDSDSEGRRAGGTPWPELLRAALDETGGGPVTIHSLAFSPVPSNSAEYAEKKVRQLAPDTVILVVASFPFVAKFVWLRVERLFGKRAGAWYKRIEDSFDSGTRGKGGGRDSVNRLARRVAPKVVGRSAYSSRKAVSANYRETFRALSRLEDVGVVLFGYPGMSEAASGRTATKERKIFFAEMKAAAAEHRFAWIDGVEIFSGHPREAVMADAFHFNPVGHAIIAAAVTEAVLGDRAHT